MGFSSNNRHTIQVLPPRQHRVDWGFAQTFNWIVPSIENQGQPEHQRLPTPDHRCTLQDHEWTWVGFRDWLHLYHQGTHGIVKEIIIKNQIISTNKKKWMVLLHTHRGSRYLFTIDQIIGGRQWSFLTFRLCTSHWTLHEGNRARSIKCHFF